MQESVRAENIGTEELLARYLAETDTDAAEQLLLALVFDHWQPVIDKIVRFKLAGPGIAPQEVEDVQSEALLQVLTRLKEWRLHSDPGIANAKAYVATIAYGCCDDFFRRRFPLRHSLKNRIRYVLKPDAGFDLWQNSAGEWLCGMAGWRGREPVRQPSSTADIRGGPAVADTVRAIFHAAGGPLRLDEMVEIAAASLGVRDVQVPLEQASAVPVAGAPYTERWERYVPGLWNEIRQLPVNQRAALLLNLRSEEEWSAIALFPLTGAASIAEIAAAVEIEPLEFATLWSRLPLGDLEIGARLGVTRQQVINLRAAARKRLERRLPEAIRGLLGRR